jgi:hypothetical protein
VLKKREGIERRKIKNIKMIENLNSKVFSRNTEDTTKAE